MMRSSWNFHSHIAIVVTPPSLKSFANQKNLSNHRVVIRKWSLVICKGFFRMTTLWFDKFFWFAKLFNHGGLTTIATWECIFLILNRKIAHFKQKFGVSNDAKFTEHAYSVFYIHRLLRREMFEKFQINRIFHVVTNNFAYVVSLQNI